MYMLSNFEQLTKIFQLNYLRLILALSRWHSCIHNERNSDKNNFKYPHEEFLKLNS